MNKHILMVLFCLLFPNAVFSQSYAKWNKGELVLTNGVIRRVISLPSPNGKLITTSYQPVKGDYKYFQSSNPDFSFEMDSRSYSGESSWSLVKVEPMSDTNNGNGAVVILRSNDNKVEIGLKYLLYPNLPVLRKSISIKNLTGKEVSLESVDVERFRITDYWATSFSWVYSNYGRRKSIGPFDGDAQDALINIYNLDWKAGLLIGNEASGVMKHTSFLWNSSEVSSGLTHKDARFPFRKWLKAGEVFETPQVFTMVYNNQKDPDQILNTSLPDFIRKHMGIRLSLLQHKPTFIYNTWHPFAKNIDEKLIMELAKAAAGAGMKEFVIDDGWQDKYGDWGVNKDKFPNGLKPVMSYIKSLGMKPGLWVSIGTAAPDSKVYAAHPEWFVKDKEGKPISLVIDENDKYTACFSTGWASYIKGVLSKLISENDLEYLKLDFSVVTSPYRFDISQSGCYADNHPGHKDHAESLYSNYEPMWKLFDELHSEKDGLFIDCTFETLGGLQLIDYALLKHAEGDWLSNFTGENEAGDLRIRNIAWWRSPAMSATALVIGNPRMDDKGWEMHVKSLAGALPIMLGDPRKLNVAERNRYKMYADWLQLMAKRYDVMSFRQDLPGFGEPAEGMWDGFQRINTDTKKGGLIGVFRHGSKEFKRMVTINFLDTAKSYQVRTMDGKVIALLTGEQLRKTGFECRLHGFYSGDLFEVCAVR